MNWLKLLLSDDCGNPSSIRAVSMASTLVYIIVWAAISIKTWTMASPPLEISGLIAALWGAKVVQKGKAAACTEPPKEQDDERVV